MDSTKRNGCLHDDDDKVKSKHQRTGQEKFRYSVETSTFDESEEDEGEGEEGEQCEQGDATSTHKQLSTTGHPPDGPAIIPQKCSGRDFKTQIRTLQGQLRQANLEISKVKIALAISNQELVEHGISIPMNSRIFAGKVGELGAGARKGPLVIANSIGADAQVGLEECPYSLQMVGLPDTSCLTAPYKFASAKGAFPHAVDVYTRTHELAPHVESKPLLLEFKLTHRTRPMVACDERDLKPGIAVPRIPFRLWLVYSDTGEKVTLESLDSSAEHLIELTTPNIIGSEVVMKGGLLTFKIQKILVYSNATRAPKHRKFRFEVECIDQHLAQYEHMHGKSVDFYSKARIRIEKPPTPS